jgi:hypothetical protein
MFTFSNWLKLSINEFSKLQQDFDKYIQELISKTHDYQCLRYSYEHEYVG